jgi:hypothetical protein
MTVYRTKFFTSTFPAEFLQSHSIVNTTKFHIITCILATKGVTIKGSECTWILIISQNTQKNNYLEEQPTIGNKGLQSSHCAAHRVTARWKRFGMGPHPSVESGFQHVLQKHGLWNEWTLDSCRLLKGSVYYAGQIPYIQ